MTANLMNGTIMHTRSTELTWRGLVALATAAYLVLEGCIPITEAVKEGPVVKEVRAVHTQGNIEVNVLPHPDNQGWTVRLSQPILREVEERRDVTVLRRYYYWQPLALPAGLFACPTSTWAWAWHIVTPMAAPEIRRNLAHYTVEACLLALMIAKSDLKRTVEDQVVSTRFEPDSFPVREGHLTLRWNGPKQVELSYPIDTDGRAVIRLSHLATAIQNAGYGLYNIPTAQVSLEAWHDNRLQSKPLLQITPTALQIAARHQVPAIARTERWPRPLVMKVRIQGNTSKTLGIEAHLSRIALRHHIPFVTSEEVRPLLRLELEHIMSGITEDQTAVSPGHWLAPTILLTVQAEETTAGSILSLQCHNIHTGELLTHIVIPSSPGGLGQAKDLALSIFDDALGAITVSRN